MDQLFKTVIVDDEEPARQIVAEFLSAYPQFLVVDHCSNGYEAVRSVGAHEPDVLFLDIQMPKLDGFEVLELLERRPAVVFVTAFDEFAVRAFEVHAVDYLLKPFTAARFDEVIQHVCAILRRHEPQPVADLQRTLAGVRRPLERIAFRNGPAIDVVPVQRIDYIEAQDDYVHVWARGARHVKQQTISDLEALLDPTRFVRVHRSYLVNLDSLSRVEPYAKDSRVAVLKDGTRVPVSRSGYDRLRELL
jgi:two-component system LytT family response regulator